MYIYTYMHTCLFMLPGRFFLLKGQLQKAVEVGAMPRGVMEEAAEEVAALAQRGSQPRVVVDHSFFFSSPTSVIL